ncbi:MAG: transcriptional regulator [Planctomycetes bacterium]|nr:transcriptional regulator [Planctomycetota bacterium]
MIRNARFPDGEDEEIPRELAELGKCIEGLSDPARAELIQAHQRVIDSVRRRRRILSLVQEALSQLRLDIKYLMFDLEVTRQERDELKQQLEDR